MITFQNSGKQNCIYIESWLQTTRIQVTHTTFSRFVFVEFKYSSFMINLNFIKHLAIEAQGTCTNISTLSAKRNVWQNI